VSSRESDQTAPRTGTRNTYAHGQDLADTTVDWNGAAEDYGRHRQPFPDVVADLLRAHGIGVPGQLVADVGTGVGTPALQIARGTTAGAPTVIGIDPAREMLAVARRRAQDAGVDLDLRVGTAEATGLDDGSVDAVTAGQCWHWFNTARAVPEFRRVLRSGGRVGICLMEWRPDLDPDGPFGRTIDVLRRNTSFRFDGPFEPTQHRAGWLADLTPHGFVEVGWSHLRFHATYTHDGWRGRLRASTWVAATQDTAVVAAIDAQLADALQGAPEPLQLPHDLVVGVFQQSQAATTGVVSGQT